jgi:hypothetical protein
MPLREGVDELREDGFSVELSKSLGSDDYVEQLDQYLNEDNFGMQPPPYIGATSPAPGAPAEQGATVVITEIECPDQAATCD